MIFVDTSLKPRSHIIDVAEKTSLLVATTQLAEYIVASSVFNLGTSLYIASSLSPPIFPFFLFLVLGQRSNNLNNCAGRSPGANEMTDADPKMQSFLAYKPVKPAAKPKYQPVGKYVPPKEGQICCYHLQSIIIITRCAETPDLLSGDTTLKASQNLQFVMFWNIL